MKVRIARHTDDLEKMEAFYIAVLGFERLGGFQNHNHYDGIFIGKPDLDWHFEFTKSESKANHTFDEDDVFVIYPSSEFEYKNLMDRILEQNISIITSKNPYWNENGKMIQDPDGFRIVISPLKIIF
jgi:catechol 2,3-dioxygenase-like lactoylglutathione lyase family enzyme